MTPMIAATIASGCACAALVIAELRGWAIVRIVTKVLASAAFITVGVLAYHTLPAGDPHARFALAVVVGLVFGAIGDVALLGHGTAPFLAGLAAFLVGHVAYVVGIVGVLPADAGAAWGLIAIPITAGAIALRWMWPHVQGTLRAPVLAYVATIIAMVGTAMVAATGAALPAGARRLLVTAAVVFFVSDLAVARDKFVAPSVANRVWGLPAYYAAQLLFAWTIATA